MKKLKIYTFLLLFTTAMYSQTSWAPIGAEWYYDKEELLIYPQIAHSYIKYEVIKDTVIKAHKARVILKTLFNFDGRVFIEDTLYSYEENSKVFFLIDNEFQMIYDFTAMQNDTLNLPQNFYHGYPIYPYIVDTVYYINIDGVDLKFQKISNVFNDDIFENLKLNFNVYEKIGSNQDIIGYKVNIEAITIPFLRCYRDKDITLEDPKIPCDTLIHKMGIKKNEMNSMKISPNPTTGILFFENYSNILKVEIYDFQGNILKTLYNPVNSQIDISEFKAGIYIVSVLEKNYIKTFIKIVKK